VSLGEIVFPFLFFSLYLRVPMPSEMHAVSELGFVLVLIYARTVSELG
jgi:hypothetical protein